MNLRLCPPDIGAAEQQVGGKEQGYGRGGAGNGIGRRQFIEQGGGLQGEQHTQRVDSLLRGGFQRRNQGGGRRHLRVGVGNVQSAHQPHPEPLAGYGRSALLRLQVVAGNDDLLLEGAQINIVERHLAGEGHLYGAAVFNRGQHVGIGCLQRSAQAPEDVRLPCRIQAGLIQIVHHPGRAHGG